MTFVAFAESTLVGSASLVSHDLPKRKDLSPWLASVYVVPTARNRGIGSALVNEVVQKASKLEIPIVYLFTWNHESLYVQLGWRVIERTISYGLDIDYEYQTFLDKSTHKSSAQINISIEIFTMKYLGLSD